MATIEQLRAEQNRRKAKLSSFNLEDLQKERDRRRVDAGLAAQVPKVPSEGELPFEPQVIAAGPVETALSSVIGLGPSRAIMSEGAQTVGAIVGGIAGEATLGKTLQSAGKIAQLVPAVKLPGKVLELAGPIIGGALGAGLGGGAGELGFQIAKGESLGKAIQRSVERGETEAIFDAAMNTIFRGGATVARGIVKPNAFARDMEKAIAKAAGDKESLFTLGELAENTTLQSVEELLRGGAFAGKAFDASDAAKGRFALEAADSFVKDHVAFLTNRFGKSRPDIASAQLRDEAAGLVLRRIINDGTQLHASASNRAFAFLDQSLKEGPLQEQVQRVARAKQAGDIRTPSDILEKPVDFSGVRRTASSIRDNSAKLGSGRTAEDVQRITNIVEGAEHLSFREAHTFLSDLKATIRDTPQSTRKALRLNQLLDEATDAMNNAGTLLGGNVKTLSGETVPFNQAYKDARNFFKFGANRLKNDFLKKLIQSDPQKIGNILATATPNEIRQIRRAVISTKVGAKREANATVQSTKDTFEEIKRQNPGVTFDEGALGDLRGKSPEVIKAQGEKAGLTIDLNELKRLEGVEQSAKEGWQKVKANALQDMLENGKDLKAGSPDFARLQALLTPRELKTFNRTKRFIDGVMKKVSRKGNLSSKEMFAAAAAGGALLGGVVSGSGEGAGSGAIGAVATFLVAPRLLAKLYTNPRAVNALLKWDQTAIGTAKYTRATSQLLTILDDIKTEVVREDKVAGLLRINEGQIVPPSTLEQVQRSPSNFLSKDLREAIQRPSAPSFHF